jgi:hypothetical protein
MTSSSCVSPFWASGLPPEPSRSLSTARRTRYCRSTTASVSSPDASGAITSTKLHGSRKTTFTGCGPWSTNGWRFIASTRIVPRRLSKNWSGIGTAFWSATVTALYRKWVNRQTCLAHLIRKADALAERKKTDLRRFGEVIAAWLRQLVSFAKEPPDPKTWSDFYTFFLFTVSVWEKDKTDAGRLARQIIREMDSLWTFLDYHGIEPTNNRAERALRFGVLWRKRSLGTQSEKGNRWVERILSLKETCRLNSKPTFPFLVECVASYFRSSNPNLSWI